MGIHKPGQSKKNWKVEFERQAEEPEQQDYLQKLPFILDFKDKKSWIAFQFQLVNWQLLLFK